MATVTSHAVRGETAAPDRDHRNKTKSPVVRILFAAAQREAATGLAGALRKHGLEPRLDDVADLSALEKQTRSERHRAVDLFVVLWPDADASGDEDALKRIVGHASDALETGRLFVVPPRVGTLPLTFQDFHIPRAYLTGYRSQEEYETAAAKIIESAHQERTKARDGVVMRFLRAVLAPVARPTSYFYQERNRFKILASARLDIEAYESLEVIDAAGKRELGRTITKAAFELAAYALWMESMESVAATVLLLLCLAIVVIVPLGGIALLNLTIAQPPSPVLIVAYVAGLIITMGILIGVPMLVQRLPDLDLRFNVQRLVPLWLAGGVLAAVILISRGQWRGNVVTWRESVAGGVAATVLLIAAAFLFAFAAGALASFLTRRQRLVMPEAVLLIGLTKLLRRASLRSLFPADADTRRDVMASLEELADTAQYGLPRCLQSGDYATDRWLVSTGERIAAAFRNLKKQAALPLQPSKDGQRTTWAAPHQGSWEQLQDCLKGALLSAARGDWASFPQAEPAKITRPQRLAQAGRFIRALLTGALPVVVFLIADHYSLVTADLRPWAVLAVLLWAVVSLLVVVDPDLPNKVSFVKDLHGTLKSPGKSE